jgi:alkane 1-monooxygenase
VPLLDYYLELDVKNPTKEEIKELKRNNWFKLPLYINLAHDFFATVFWIYIIQTRDLNLMSKIGIVLMNSNRKAAGINLAHEIGHKPAAWEKIVSILSLGKSLYMHFFIEHNYGHHKNVSTPGDPATSRFGETLILFLPRSVFGSYLSAWEIENERCEEKYKSK